MEAPEGRSNEDCEFSWEYRDKVVHRPLPQLVPAHLDHGARGGFGAHPRTGQEGITLHPGQELLQGDPFRRLRGVPTLVVEAAHEQRQLSGDMRSHVRLEPVTKGVQHGSEHVVGAMDVVDASPALDRVQPS